MSRNLVETITGAVVLAVAGWFFFNAYQQTGSSAGKGHYQLKASFSDVTGVGIGSDVRIGGVKIGAVESLSLDNQTYQAEVLMNIEQQVKLPVDSSAAIVGESLLGGKFIALTPGGDENMLVSGEKIEFTQSSISLEQLLGKFVFSGGGVDSEDSPSDSAKNDSADHDLSSDEEDVDFTLP